MPPRPAPTPSKPCDFTLHSTASRRSLTSPPCRLPCPPPPAALPPPSCTGTGSPSLSLLAVLPPLIPSRGLPRLGRWLHPPRHSVSTARFAHIRRRLESASVAPARGSTPLPAPSRRSCAASSGLTSQAQPTSMRTKRRRASQTSKADWPACHGRGACRLRKKLPLPSSSRYGWWCRVGSSGEGGLLSIVMAMTVADDRCNRYRERAFEQGDRGGESKRVIDSGGTRCMMT